MSRDFLGFDLEPLSFEDIQASEDYAATFEDVPDEAFSCHTCNEKYDCPFAYDYYNLNGDCLASK